MARFQGRQEYQPFQSFRADIFRTLPIAARNLARFDFSEQPLQAREVLLIVAAQEMDQAEEGHRAVAFEGRRSAELGGRQPLEEAERLRARARKSVSARAAFDSP
jgi:hypothetical protein